MGHDAKPPRQQVPGAPPARDVARGMTGTFTVEVLEGQLVRLIPGYPEARLSVAISGGVDSVALLHAARLLATRHPSLALRAIHVDHGLQAESAGWSARSESLCRDLEVPLEVIRLSLAPRAGASVEAEARTARYAAIAASLGEGECLLTAHHRDDQLETLLLQLARGAGVDGLAAMPRAAVLGPGIHLRPLLDVDRDELVAWARGAGLDWIDDPMNDDSRFDRAWLRHHVLPALRQRWPALARTVSRSAGHLAEASRLLEDLAEIDAAGLVDAGRLSVTGLLTLPRPRRINVLRWWLAGHDLGMPSTARLGAIVDDVLTARVDAGPVVRWAGAEVRRYRGWLHAMRPLEPPPGAGWQRGIGPGEVVELPSGLGTLSLERTIGTGLAAVALQGPLLVRFRRGGERLRPYGHVRQRTLKNLCQESGVLPWMRDRLPMLEASGRLVAIGDLWIAAEAAAPAGGPAWRVVWRGPVYR